MHQKNYRKDRGLNAGSNSARVKDSRGFLFQVCILKFLQLHGFDKSRWADFSLSVLIILMQEHQTPNIKSKQP